MNMTMVNSGFKWLNIKFFKCLVPSLPKMSDFYPLGVLGRSSETQLQVGENLNYLF